MLSIFRSFRAYTNKEIKEGFRTQRFLILSIGILFFSIADPVMLKFMPEILKNSVEGVDFSSLINQTRAGALANYTKSLYQIGTFVIVFTLMGLLAGERNKKTLTIPVSMGCSVTGVLLGKLLVYGGCLVILTLAGLSVAYYYAGIIFGTDSTSYLAVVKAGMFYAMYYLFTLSIILLVNSLTDKQFLAGISALLIGYCLPLLDYIKGFGKFLPTTLINEATRFVPEINNDTLITIVSTIIVIILLNILTGRRLKKISYN